MTAARADSWLRRGDSENVLSIRNLHTHFKVHGGVVKAVDGVNLTIPTGKTVGLVGESGCGKSITALSVMQLLESNGRIVAGEIYLRDRDLIKISEDELREVRGRIPWYGTLANHAGIVLPGQARGRNRKVPCAFFVLS